MAQHALIESKGEAGHGPASLDSVLGFHIRLAHGAVYRHFTETFATLGAPNDAALQPTGEGLEMVPISHPNDLVTGEPAQFRFLNDGAPAAGMAVEFVAGGTRYRDIAGSKELVTDADGVLELTVDAPGFYYLEASVESYASDAPGIDSSRASYTAVLEFLPL